MKKIMAMMLMMLCFGCSACTGGADSSSVSDKSSALWEKDLSGFNAYGQETRINYGFAWKPQQADGYVGDVMPYYENGVYSLFYLKDEGGSLRHSVYRVDTKNFIDYEDKGLVLESRGVSFQDYWIGTGSVVKAENDYYFFYTGFNNTKDVWEKVMVAKSSGNMDNFVRISTFSIAPPEKYSQRDFRDPQVYYDAATKTFNMTVESNSAGKARIVRYRVSLDLKKVEYVGDMYTDEKYGFWNLECADIFDYNGKYYLTYSAQGNPMDTVWIAESDKMFSGYINHRRIEGLHFYAAKTVKGDDGIYLIGWMYRKQDQKKGICDDASLYWGGHVVVHKIEFGRDGEPYLAPIDGFDDYYGYTEESVKNEMQFSENVVSSAKLCDGKESYMLTGNFVFENEGDFGVVLGYDDEYKRYISYSYKNKNAGFYLRDAKIADASITLSLEKDKEYSFVYVQEGSVGLFYVLGEGGFSFRVYGINNKKIGLFSNNNEVKFTNLKYSLRLKRGI